MCTHIFHSYSAITVSMGGALGSLYGLICAVANLYSGNAALREQLFAVDCAIKYPSEHTVMPIVAYLAMNLQRDK